VLDEFPLNANGKLDARKLPMPEDRSHIQRPYTAPRTPAERALGEIWREVLNVKQVGVDDDFFELGGNSLLAMKLISVLAERLCMKVSFLAVLQNTTIRRMTHFIDVGFPYESEGITQQAGQCEQGIL